MGEAVKRNQPCYCGSGKKYKSCHLGKPNPEVRKKRMVLPVILAVAGIGLGAFIIVTKGKIAAGIAFGLAGLVFAGLVAVFRDPPPADTTKDPGAINFGG